MVELWIWGGFPSEGALLLLAEPTPLLHSQAFTQFARTEVIQRMEIFEYCQQLRQPGAFLLPFQVVEMQQQVWCSSSDLPQNMHPEQDGRGVAKLHVDPWVIKPMTWGALSRAGMKGQGRGDLMGMSVSTYLHLLCFPLLRHTSSSMPLAWPTTGSQPRPCNTVSRSPPRSWARIRPSTLSWSSK